MAIKTRKISDWLSANGQAITNASAASMKAYLEQNLRSLQDGVYIGKIQKETWGSYMRCEAWQTSSIGISRADADAVVVQHGSTRIGIALTEPSAAMKWGSVHNASSVGYQTSSDWSLLDGQTRTAAIMASSYYKNDSPSTYAVAYCYNYSKSHTGDPGGDFGIPAKSWHLPATGELEIIRSHFETINLALQRIKSAGKQNADLLQQTHYWSCVESSGNLAWNLDFGLGYRGSSGKVDNSYRVRPVTAF
jgi:hypothetical protein|nr:MAG TPA: Protein of unknown function (DUF1566) [Caudoviricetes sp.]